MTTSFYFITENLQHHDLDEMKDGKEKVQWINLRGIKGLTKFEWMVVIAVSKSHSLSKYLTSAFSQAVIHQCQYVVVPLELHSICPGDVARSCIQVLSESEYPFEVIFQCRQEKNTKEVARLAETFFKNQNRLCVRETTCPDLLPNTGEYFTLYWSFINFMKNTLIQ